MVLAECPHRLLEQVQPPRPAAGPGGRLHARVVDGRGKGESAGGGGPVTGRTLSRRVLISACALAGLALLLLAAGGAGATQAGEKRHGLSVFGDLKYPPDFKHFDYVNPDAPKGGRLSMIGSAGLITFNSLNGYILKGDPAQGIGLLFDQLMVRAADEPDAMYGLVAHAAQKADDGSSVTFYMRPEARFSDGTPVTAQDAVFSLEILKRDGHPRYALQLRDVARAEALDTHTVRYVFSGRQTRDLPQIVAGLPIFSKAYYATRVFKQTTLEPPLGSGP
ncbi:MAG: hypothetical protein D6773_01670, partial [Alphaproteobacteria bacterium]